MHKRGGSAFQRLQMGNYSFDLAGVSRQGRGHGLMRRARCRSVTSHPLYSPAPDFVASTPQSALERRRHGCGEAAEEQRRLCHRQGGAQGAAAPAGAAEIPRPGIPLSGVRHRAPRLQADLEFVPAADAREPSSMRSNRLFISTNFKLIISP